MLIGIVFPYICHKKSFQMKIGFHGDGALHDGSFLFWEVIGKKNKKL